MRFTTLVSAAAFSRLSIASYVLQDDYMADFYSNFNFFTDEDPTQGFVKYIDEATARQTNLINASAPAHFGVDVTNKTPGGRPSIRIESKKKYDSGLIVLDLEHMPFGCGTWPAFWTLGPNWPKGGEIDILEGVNEYTNNGMTLHTGPGCQIGSNTAQFSGSVTTGNCDIRAEGQSMNAGCSIEHPSTNSYGAGLNKNGGGVYATQWDSDGISIYFFPRGSVPADVLSECPNPSGWGKPAAKFAGACDIDKMFAEQQIIIDTTFCGQWAGRIWEDGSCAKKANTCEEYVRDNPEAFTEAYWNINALKVYQSDGKPPVAPSVPAISPTSSALPVPEPVTSSRSKPAVGYPEQPTQAPIEQQPSGGLVIPGITTPAPQSTQVPVAPNSSSVAASPEISSIPVIPDVPEVSAPTRQSTRASTVPQSSGAPALSEAPAPGPQSSRTREGSGPPSPSKTLDDQTNAPTGAYGLPGWNWPQAGDEEPGARPAPASTTTAASASGAPVQGTSSVVAVPTPEQNVTQPSQVPANPAPAPVPEALAPPAQALAPLAPIVPDTPAKPCHTIYETVYVTAPAQAAATPGPEAYKGRKARRLRDQRRRLAQLHARP